MQIFKPLVINLSDVGESSFLTAHQHKIGYVVPL